MSTQPVIEPSGGGRPSGRSTRARLLVTCGLIVLAWPSAAAAQFVRVSRALDGAAANGHSYGPRISADGTALAFVSVASNLVAGDTNGRADVFVANLVTGAIERVSVNSDGTQRTEDSGTGGLDLSADGRVIVFTSAEPPPDGIGRCLVPPATAAPCSEIYVHDRTTHLTTRLDLGDGQPATAASSSPHISDDGRFVVAVSSAQLGTTDTNGVDDVVVVDRAAGTSRRVSLATGGGQANGASGAPVISADGLTILFTSVATNLDAAPDPLPCGVTTCLRAYVHDLANATTARVPFASTGGAVTIRGATMDASGRFIAAHADHDDQPMFVDTRRIWLYDRTTRHQTIALSAGSFSPHSQRVGYQYALSGDGSAVALGSNPLPGTPGIPLLSLLDRRTGSVESVPACLNPAPFDLSRDGLTLAVTARCTWESPGGPFDPWNKIFLYRRDVDGDRMADAWEAAVGLDPNDPADALVDSDADGVANGDEYRAGSYPRRMFTAFLAEGSAGGFFTTGLAMANPGDADARVAVRLIGSTGDAASRLLAVPGEGRVDLTLDRFSDTPGPEFGILVEADRPIVAERTMTWDGGAHAERATLAPGTRWLIAEGATHGAFSTYYLLLNPGDRPADVTVKYLRPAPAAAIVKSYRVPPRSRRTLAVDDEDPGLAATDVAADITSSEPIVVERSLYLAASSEPWRLAAGLSGAAVAPASRWVLAEGTTGPAFDLYYLIANPAAHATRVRITYLVPSGAVTREYVVPAESRLTLAVDEAAPELTHAAVSAIVEALDGTGIAVERSMWWPGGGPWVEGHLAAGTMPARGWMIASAVVDATSDVFIVVTNPTDLAGTLTLTISGPASAPTSHSLAIAARGRLTIPLRRHVVLEGAYAVRVESEGPAIVVERAIYRRAGDAWTAGTAALGTPVP
jgi:hypothetical protein